MARIAYIDGQYQPAGDPAIMVEDRGYQFADGVYEVFAIRQGHLLDEDLHLARLQNSLAEMDIPEPASMASMKLVMRELMRRNRVREGILYLQVTRGVARREHIYRTRLRPVLVMTVTATNPAARAKVRREGISVISVPDQRWARCDIKSISLLPNVLARQSAYTSGAGEAWQVDAAGFVTEGAATNAFIVDREDCLRTRLADNGILNGIVRQVLIDIAYQLNYEMKEVAFTLEEAKNAQECFSTASTLAVFPVVSIDGCVIGEGKPGPVASALAERYDALAKQPQ
ncbi:MAG: D-amino-acid transaminase [Alphaproteobacteria bacterium]|nr:D-amino-acid transaminase [Alphaproteobacteria bacterium]